MWVNVAFTSVFAPFDEITPEEFARVTEVSYLGYVYGTMAALRRMKPRDRGTIVQVGSALAYRGIPLQTAYCGAKHAIQGFHESLRCELLHEKSNVHVTMVQMPAVNTPQFSWVLSRLPRHPQPVPPIYQPEVAARAVVHAADHPRRREYWVGATTAATLVANAVAPGTARPVPRPDRVRLAADRRSRASADAAGEPLGAGRRGRRARLRRARRLRRPSHTPQRAAVGQPAPRRGRDGCCRPGSGSGRAGPAAPAVTADPAAPRGLGLARVARGHALAGRDRDGSTRGRSRLPTAGRTAATALAVRDLAQGSWLVVQPGPPAAEAGAVIDVLHGVSMLPLVVLAPRYRKAAAVSAGAATGWALAAAWLLSRPQVSAGRGVAS